MDMELGMYLAKRLNSSFHSQDIYNLGTTSYSLSISHLSTLELREYSKGTNL